MNAELYQITYSQFESMLGDVESRQVNLDAARLSAEIIVGMYGDKPMCFIGFAPVTMLSDQAYVWMLLTAEGHKHPLLFARHAESFLRRALDKYARIFGHCFTTKSAVWLRYLGANFFNDVEFEFRRH